MKYDLKTGTFIDMNDEIIHGKKYIRDNIEIYKNKNVDEDILGNLNYEVFVHDPHSGKEGALQMGTSILKSGDINGEFYMTRGHTHEIKNRDEYYICLQGEGVLLLMDSKRNTEIIDMQRNSFYNIEGNVAHRLINIGDEDLVVMACWNSDAGHDYEEISEKGFSVRLYKSSDEKYEIEYV